MPIAEGQPAPPFALPDQNGDRVSLESLRGKHVIVYFYPKDDTPGCTKEACGFRDLWDEIGRTGAVVLGVSPDDADAHNRFIEKYRLPMTLLCDPDKTMMTEYDAYREKMLYGVWKLGVVRSTVWIGPDGNVIKHWKRVPQAAGHPAKILSLLQESV